MQREKLPGTTTTVPTCCTASSACRRAEESMKKNVENTRKTTPHAPVMAKARLDCRNNVGDLRSQGTSSVPPTGPRATLDTWKCLRVSYRPLWKRTPY